ncbi:unnamed protein product, partial [Sphacelaria rigidula]
VVVQSAQPENLLIMSDKGMDTAKLADFGFALRLPMPDPIAGNAVDTSPADMTSPRGLPACGTPEYIAPEVLLQQPFNGKADVWSAGVTAFCLLSGVMPFKGLTLDKLYTAIMDGACSYAGPEWTNISPHGVDFVQRMLEVNPRERWSAGELLQHPWMLTPEGDSVGLGCVGGGEGEERETRRPRVRLRSVVLGILFANRLLRM